MAGPNYNANPVRNVVIAVRVMHAICRLVLLVDRRIQASALDGETKTASASFKSATLAFCEILVAAYEALPD